MLPGMMGTVASYLGLGGALAGSAAGETDGVDGGGGSVGGWRFFTSEVATSTAPRRLRVRSWATTRKKYSPLAGALISWRYWMPCATFFLISSRVAAMWRSLLSRLTTTPAGLKTKMTSSKSAWILPSGVRRNVMSEGSIA